MADAPARDGSSAALTTQPDMTAALTPPPSERAATFREVMRFVAVGMISSVGYALLFIVLTKGLGLHPQLANHLALIAAAIWSILWSSRITFGYRGGSHLLGVEVRDADYRVLRPVRGGLFRRRTPGPRLDLGRGNLLHPYPRFELRRHEAVDVCTTRRLDRAQLAPVPMMVAVAHRSARLRKKRS